MKLTEKPVGVPQTGPLAVATSGKLARLNLRDDEVALNSKNWAGEGRPDVGSGEVFHDKVVVLQTQPIQRR